MADTFTRDQVAALWRWQMPTAEDFAAFRVGHPFTCFNRGDGRHVEIGSDLGMLIPTVRGWICPFCDYTQDWAHNFMTTPPTSEAL